MSDAARVREEWQRVRVRAAARRLRDAEAEAGRLREVAKELAARPEHVTKIAMSSTNPASVRQARVSRHLLDAAWPLLTEEEDHADA